MFHDETVFQKPYLFDPERLISKDGTLRQIQNLRVALVLEEGPDYFSYLTYILNWIRICPEIVWQGRRSTSR